MDFPYLTEMQRHETRMQHLFMRYSSLKELNTEEYVWWCKYELDLHANNLNNLQAKKG